MDDILRQRLIRKIESLPEEQVYQVMDFIEFLDTKYGGVPSEASGLQRFAEGLQDRMRRKAMNPATIREAFQVISTADKVLSSVSNAGRQLMDELTRGGQLSEDDTGEGKDRAADAGIEEREPRPAETSSRRTAEDVDGSEEDDDVVLRSSDIGRKPGAALDGGEESRG